jgi:hypothetical protein
MAEKPKPKPRRRKKPEPSVDSAPEKEAESTLTEQKPEAELPECPYKSLISKIIWVRQNLPKTIEKDKEVGTGSFAYSVVTHENINSWLKPLLNRAGLLDYISEDWQEVVDSGKRQGSKNNPVLYVKGWYTYTVINADVPTETLSIKVTGWGEDAGDKGPGKAQTYAFKAGRTKMFSIAAGENEEGRIADKDLSDNTPKLTPEQYSAMIEKADELFGDDSQDMLKLMSETLFGNVPLTQIPREMYPQAIDALERKKAAIERRGKPETTADDVS